MNGIHSTAAAPLPRALGALASVRRAAIDAWLGRAALVTLRYGLILILVFYGAFKFTEAEARAIEPLIAPSPLLGWTYAFMGVQAVSSVIGVTELLIASLIALRPWSASACAIGSLAAVPTFVMTLSFLFTTPGIWVDVPGFALRVPNELGAFVLKDVFLLGAALLSAAEAFAASRPARAAS
ncbi:DUF417 family protein [Sorangium sp. So ce1153]|uniref:DUF417 family protein n=1 Tax=Sorangium sp. So ce1153 TaxID=3133333 RepID=UPI003F606AB9